MVHVVATNGRSFVVEPGRTDTLIALVSLAVRDELSNTPLTDVAASAELRLAAGTDPVVALPVTASSDGSVSVIGRLDEALPNVAAQSYVVTLEIRSRAHVSTRVDVPIAAGTSVFPQRPPDVLLRRPATRLSVRLLADGVFPPAPPAAPRTVEVTNPPRLVGWSEPLVFDHPAGTPVEEVVLAPSGTTTTLLFDGAIGRNDITVLDRTGLAVDDVLRIQGALHTELHVIAGITGPPNPARPGTIELRSPVRNTHRRDMTVIELMTVAPSGNPTSLSDRVDRGELVALVDDRSLLSPASICRIGPPLGPTSEYAQVVRLAGMTTAEGHIVLGPIGRSPSVQLTVTPGPVVATIPLAYDQVSNTTELRVGP